MKNPAANGISWARAPPDAAMTLPPTAANQSTAVGDASASATPPTEQAPEFPGSAVWRVELDGARLQHLADHPRCQDQQDRRSSIQIIQRNGDQRTSAPTPSKAAAK